LFLDLFKNSRAFLQFWHFLGFLRISSLYEKSWIESMDHWTMLALSARWTHDHGAAWLLQGSGCHRDRSERERERRRSSGFSPMAPLRGGAAEMATRRHSTEAIDGALMRR
jgi:hypothetical protein